MKRVLSVALVCVLLVSMLAFPVAAEDTGDLHSVFSDELVWFEVYKNYRQVSPDGFSASVIKDDVTEEYSWVIEDWDAIENDPYYRWVPQADFEAFANARYDISEKKWAEIRTMTVGSWETGDYEEVPFYNADTAMYRIEWVGGYGGAIADTIYRGYTVTEDRYYAYLQEVDWQYEQPEGGVEGEDYCYQEVQGDWMYGVYTGKYLKHECTYTDGVLKKYASTYVEELPKDIVATKAGQTGTLGVLSYIFTNEGVTIARCDPEATGEVVIPAEIEGYPVTYIGNMAFEDCREIESVVIPDSVTDIAYSAFYYCDALTSVTIGAGVSYVSGQSFFGCDNIKTVTVAEGNPVYHSAGNCVIHTQNKEIVLGCANSVIPDDGSVTRISYSAFFGLTDIVIPAAITEIGQNAFFNCDNIQSITVAEGNPVYHSAGNCLIDTANKEIVLGCDNSVIPNDGTVTAIGSMAFSGYAGETLALPDNLLSIGRNAFYGAQLMSITVPDGVTTIEDSAFYECHELVSIELPDTLTKIGSYAFSGTGVYSDYSNWNNCVLYIDGYLIQVQDNVKGSYEIADGTKGIADWAFPWGVLITELTIPKSVQFVGEFATVYLESLATVYYGGSEENRNAMLIGDNNEPLINAAWQYGNGKPVIKEPAFVVGDAVAEKGDLVKIPVSVVNNPGIVSLKLSIVYDATVLELVSVDKQKDFAIGSGVSNGPLTNNPFVLNWSDFLATANVTTNGVVAELTFKVKDDAALGDTQLVLGYNPDDVCDMNFDSVDFTAISGKVTVRQMNALNVMPPDRQTYIEGEDFDFSDMKVFAEYSDGTSEEVTDYTVTGWDPTPGTKTITVTYRGYTSTFPVTVLAKRLTSIEVSTLPHKLTYFAGQSLDITGLKVKANYSNGTSELVTDYTVSGFDRYTVGAQWLTVAYEDQTTTFAVAVNEAVVDDVTPLFMTESKIVRKGQTIQVAVSVKNNPGIVSTRLWLDYDTNVLELVGAEGADFAGASFGPLTADPFAVNWYDTLQPNNTTDGTLAILTFNVKEEAAIGDTAITISYNEDDVYNDEFENVSFATVRGTLSVVDYTPGDVTDDGKVNNKDLGVLLQYLNGWDVELVEEAGDVTGDGKINNKDLGVLLQYLNGWDVELK